jgi:hypothetical protein
MNCRWRLCLKRRRRTGSILGVTLAHGITNIMLYLVWPLIFRH